MIQSLPATQSDVSPTNAAPKRRRGRWWKIPLAVFGVIVLLASGWIGSVHWRISQELGRIRAAGEPVMLHDLDAWYAQPVGPNAADAYLKAISTTVEDEALLPRLHWRNSAAWDEPLTADHLEAMRELVRNNTEALKLVHEAAEIEGARYPVDLAEGMEADISHLTRIRFMVRILEAHVTIACEDERSEEFVDGIITMFRLGRSLENEPIVVSQLTRMFAEI